MSDSGLIEGLMTIEIRLVAAYEAALSREAIEPALGELLLDQEREHVRGLEHALRRLGGGSPRATVPDRGLTTALRDPGLFTEYALRLESEAMAAYVRASANIVRSQLRQPLGSIMTSEAAHTVALRQAANLPLITPVS
jgi:hypothetical protein